MSYHRYRRQTTTPREILARRLLREMGAYQVESVSMLRQQHDGEFAAIVEFNTDSLAAIIRLLTDPRQQTLEITRIHAGQSATRIYVRFDEPRPEPTPEQNVAEWQRIEAALATLEGRVR